MRILFANTVVVFTRPRKVKKLVRKQKTPTKCDQHFTHILSAPLRQVPH
jgi:hypothetical protein